MYTHTKLHLSSTKSFLAKPRTDRQMDGHGETTGVPVDYGTPKTVTL